MGEEIIRFRSHVNLIRGGMIDAHFNGCATTNIGVNVEGIKCFRTKAIDEINGAEAT